MISALLSCSNKTASLDKCNCDDIDKSLIASIKQFSSLEEMGNWDKEFSKIKSVKEKKNRISDLKLNYNSRLKASDQVIKGIARVDSFDDPELNLWAEYFYWKLKSVLLTVESEVIRNR
ncbi:MAG: hypothetical protein HRT57_13180 [Crocinitomicaceae bacterium]|nr:hypothetical protein [Crocinitomicaceae bacterium]